MDNKAIHFLPKAPAICIDYSALDPECVNLCRVINSIEGLCTIDSCCGHGNTPYHIFFIVRDNHEQLALKNLPVLLYYVDS